MKKMTQRPAWICLFAVTLAIPGVLGMTGCPKPTPQPTGDYVGDAPCAQCHANIHANWSQTLHAHAIAMGLAFISVAAATALVSASAAKADENTSTYASGSLQNEADINLVVTM